MLHQTGCRCAQQPQPAPAACAPAPLKQTALVREKHQSQAWKHVLAQLVRIQFPSPPAEDRASDRHLRALLLCPEPCRNACSQWHSCSPAFLPAQQAQAPHLCPRSGKAKARGSGLDTDNRAAQPASSALPRSSGIASRDTRETSVSWCNHSGSTATEFENTPGKVFRVFGLDSIQAEGQLSLHQLQWHNANSCGPDWRAPSIMPSLDHP